MLPLRQTVKIIKLFNRKEEHIFMKRKNKMLLTIIINKVIIIT